MNTAPSARTPTADRDRRPDFVPPCCCSAVDAHQGHAHAPNAARRQARFGTRAGGHARSANGTPCHDDDDRRRLTGIPRRLHRHRLRGYWPTQGAAPSPTASRAGAAPGSIIASTTRAIPSTCCPAVDHLPRGQAGSIESTGRFRALEELATVVHGATATTLHRGSMSAAGRTGSRRSRGTENGRGAQASGAGRAPGTACARASAKPSGVALRAPAEPAPAS